MFGARPRREIGSALADKLERQIRPEPMDLRQVDPENRIQSIARGEVRSIGLFGFVSGSGQRLRRCRAGRLQLLQNRLDPLVALRYFFLMDVVQL